MNGRTYKARLQCIRAAINTIGLQLDQQVVLTEVGTNNFALTPLIAQLAGARRVIGWCKDTAYGTAGEAAKGLRQFCCESGIPCNIDIRQNERPPQDIRDATIITNLGMLRPINDSFLKHVNRHNSVVSLMYDAWETRETDIDLQYCRQRGIRVFGVDESVGEFPIFDFVGPLGAKMAFQAGYEILGNDIIIWSADPFGHRISEYFQKMGARKVIITLDRATLMANLPSADFVLFADYNENRTLVGRGEKGKSCIINLDEIIDIAPNVGFIHLYGELDPETVKGAKYLVFPFRKGSYQQMTFTLAEVGPVPFIRLMAAGLRAAQEVLLNEPLRFAQPIVLQGQHNGE